MCKLVGMTNKSHELKYEMVKDLEGYLCFGNNYTVRCENLYKVDNDTLIAIYGDIDPNVLYKIYKNEGIKGFNRLEGGFAFAIITNSEIVLARDHLGINSLFYAFVDDELYFSDDILFLVKYLGLNKIDKNGILQLLSTCPMIINSKTVYKDIYRINPGEALIFKDNISHVKYFDFVKETINSDLDDVIDNIKKNINVGKKGATLLSGGLDSSIVLSLLGKNTNSYTIKYENNDFKKDKFLISDDLNFVGYMIDKYKSNNKIIEITNDDLINNLSLAVDLRGYPAMSSIDSSLLTLLNKINEDVIYTGEGSDEIFSGYPWCYNTYPYQSRFPWLRNISFKESIINKKYKGLIDNFINEEYSLAYKNCNNEDKNTFINYLNLKYFLPNLLERQEKMANNSKKEMISPFVNINLAKLMYNIDNEYKFLNNKEKGLLREAYKDQLPEEIYSRKKSPYPKTNNKEFLLKIKNKLYKCLENKNSILYELFDVEEIKKLDDNLDISWYGQLMNLAELYAFLYQIDYWANTYNIKIVE